MISISHKAKQILEFCIKLFVLVASFSFIYFKCVNDKQLEWESISKIIAENFTPTSLIILLLMSVLNRVLEILKWQNLVSSFKYISFFEATKQVLGALPLAIFTPNGLGEYAAKALFYEKKQTKNIVFLNFLCNGIQMFYTVFFGLIGLFFLGFYKQCFVLVTIIFFIFLLLILSKNITIKSFSIDKVIKKAKAIKNTIHIKNSLLAFARYLTFTHQYYFLFLLFNVHVGYLDLVATIVVVYFIASSLPTFQFLDFAVKGSVAVYFFSFFLIPDWVVVFIATFMWFLNMVLPVILGSFFVLTYKYTWKSSTL